MTATATAPKPPTAPKPLALPIRLAAIGLDEFRAHPFVPGGLPPARDMGSVPRACLCLTFLLDDKAPYHAAKAAAVKVATDRMAAIRDEFAKHKLWLNVVAIEARLAALRKEQKHAEARARLEAGAVRQSITFGDRAAESTAATALKDAESAAAEAARLHAIVNQQLPAARAAAREELRVLLEAERARLEASALAEVAPLVAEMTEYFARIAPRFAAANARAGVASSDGNAAFTHGAPNRDGLVEFFAKLPT